jgi:hypothetical protein
MPLNAVGTLRYVSYRDSDDLLEFAESAPSAKAALLKGFKGGVLI